VAARKGSKPNNPPAPRKSVVDVDPAWLEEIAEEERPPTKRGRPAPPPPSAAPRRNTIPVQSSWLIPPLPEEVKTEGKKSRPPVRKPSRPPVVITTKPKGKLPPPLPRTDDEDDSGK
jgi:hypothetical protein